METTIERHGLVGVERGGNLHGQRREGSEVSRLQMVGNCFFCVGQTSHNGIYEDIKKNLNDLCPPELLHLFHCGEIVDRSILNDSQEDKQEACPQIDVYSFDVRHLRHRG